MGREMSTVERLARAVARRALVRDLLNLTPRGLITGALVALIAVLADRLLGGVVAWPALLATPILLAVAVAGLVAWLRRWSLERAALEADLVLGLPDRISSALELSHRPQAGATAPFVTWALAEGESAARMVEPARVVPWKLERSWVIALAVVLAAALAGWLVPAWERAPARPGPTVSPALLTVSSQALDAAREVVDRLADIPASDDLMEARIRALEEIQRELEQSRVDPQEAMVRAARELEQAAEALDRRAENLEADIDRLREALAAAATHLSPSDEATATFGEYLREGDLASAAAAAQALAAAELTPVERQRLGEELQRLAEALESHDGADDAPAEEPVSGGQGRSDTRPEGGTRSRSAQEPVRRLVEALRDAGAAMGRNASDEIHPAEGTPSSPPMEPRAADRRDPSNAKPQPQPSLERVGECLSEAADAIRQADDCRSSARDVRRLAREMLAADDERSAERIRQLAQRVGSRSAGLTAQPVTLRPPAGPMPDTAAVPVDVRRESADPQAERVVAQLWSDRRVARASEAPPLVAALREAADSAEQAIEQQVIPPRYAELVRNVFRRYARQAESPAP